jgi:hypothetical protein
MKNQSIKPIGRYAVGGATEDSCMEEYVAADGKKRKRRKKGGCGYAKSQRVNARRKFWNSDAGTTIKKVGAGVTAAGAAVGAYAKNAFGVKDKIKELTGQKKGGAVKKMSTGGATKKYQAGGGASIVAAMKKGGATKKKK